MAALPLILAGPIVRRVEPRSVSVWVALRDSVPVTLRLWAGTQRSTAGGNVDGGNAPLVTSAPVTPRRFGQRLHVAVVTAEPSVALTPGTIVSYDLQLGGSAGNSWLLDQKLLANEPNEPRLPGVDKNPPLQLALGYGDNRLPAFVTPPPTVDRIRIAHASCRKGHGPGFDALAWLDDRIQSTFTDVDDRPQQLFLTGDQIYADEVGACLLPMLSGLAADLLGAAERMPLSDTATVDANLTNFPPLFRQRLVRTMAGFTSTSASNHLLSFGEFAAMYLAVWSPRVWRAIAEPDDVVKLPNAAASVRPHLSKLAECAAEKKKTFDEHVTPGVESEREQLELFRSAVPKVSRALANVATYMIFDDHEITDDWNLNQRWRNRVYTKPFGRAIVRNGVMAYGVFQAWGNDPKKFSAPDESASKPNHNRQLLEETEKVFAGNGPYPAAGAQRGRLDELVGAAGAEAKQPTFNYQVPCPRHLVAVLDTRTRRGFTGQGVLPPSLLGSTLNAQVPAKLTDGRELLIVVSPAPVLGPHLMDAVAQPLLQTVQDVTIGAKNLFADPPGPCEHAGRTSGAEQYDAEGWAAHPTALEDLLARLAPHGRAVILSGDVHYGCSLVLDYWRKGSGGNDPPPARIVQLTSSPSRNNFRAEVEAVLRSSALLQRYQAGPRPERLAWKTAAPIVIPAGQRVGPGRRARMKRSPALVPARQWPPGTTIPADKPPDWRWRLTLERDLRPENDPARPLALRQPPLDEELNPASPAAGYALIAGRHAELALRHFDHLRQMIFANNLGLVTLSVGSNGALRVTHTLLSKDAPESVTFAANTVHPIPLAPTTEARPELKTR